MLDSVLVVLSSDIVLEDVLDEDVEVVERPVGNCLRCHVRKRGFG